jgi:hypothetical protein
MGEMRLGPAHDLGVRITRGRTGDLGNEDEMVGLVEERRGVRRLKRARPRRLEPPRQRHGVQRLDVGVERGDQLPVSRSGTPDGDRHD